LKKKLFDLALGNSIYAILSGLLSIYVARALGPSERGILAILVGSVLIASSILNFGISHAAAFYIRSRPGSSKTILKFINYNLIFTIVLSCMFLALGREPFARLFLDRPDISHSLIALIIIYTATNTANICLGAAIIAVGDSRRYSYNLTLGIIITCAVTTSSFEYFNPSVEIALIGLIAGQLVNNFAFRLTFNRYVKWDSAERLPARAFIHYGLKAYVGSISALVFKRVDLLIIGLFLNPAAVGLYSVGLSLREFALIIPRALSGLTGGEVAENSSRGRTKENQKILKKALSAAGLISTGIFAVSLISFPVLIPLLFGEAYRPAVVPSSIIMGSLIPLSAGIILGSYITNKGAPLYTSLGNLISGMLTVFVMFYMTKTIGLTGAAWALIFGSLILVVALLIGYYLLNKRESQKKKLTKVFFFFG
jgi:O-antigen/teichoic acid export membrane protein